MRPGRFSSCSHARKDAPLDGLSLASASLIPGGSGWPARPAGKPTNGTSNDLRLASVRFDGKKPRRGQQRLGQTDPRG